ncbi:MAG: TIR domain-containing protein [Anaeroplasmataceae bacterium]|nr:TIR domain-containing protein [Anaeroplasmataceae bacterium]
MKKANTVQEYIDFYISGIDVKDIESNENLNKELINYLQEHKLENANLLLLYARCLHEGIGIDSNIDVAVEIYETLAEQGYSRAQHSFGYCNHVGLGVVQDYKQAVYWYEKAAAQGNAKSQNNLGVCYKTGQGVVQDYKQAVYWYKKAAMQGNAKSQENLGNCYFKGEGANKSFEKAVYWYKKAAKQGKSSAQNHLGNCYFEGKGITKSYQQAVYWYKKAAEQGEVEAQCKLGDCYLENKGVLRNYQQAIYWYEQSAKQGNLSAQKSLGHCYEVGLGEQSYEKALVYYKRAATQGDVNAQKSYERIKKILKESWIISQPIQNSKYVFISYSHKDNEIVLPFIKELQKKYNVWYDEKILLGKEWPSEIIDKIENCSLFISIVTKNSLKSQQCKNELAYALKLNVKFINVLFEETQLTKEFEFSYGLFQMFKLYSYPSLADALLDFEKRSDIKDCLKTVNSKVLTK